MLDCFIAESVKANRRMPTVAILPTKGIDQVDHSMATYCPSRKRVRADPIKSLFEQDEEPNQWSAGRKQIPSNKTKACLSFSQKNEIEETKRVIAENAGAIKKMMDDAFKRRKFDSAKLNNKAFSH